MRFFGVIGSSLGAAFLSMALIAPASAQTPLENATRYDDVLRIPNADPKMAAAMKRAQATLGDFLALSRKPKASMSGFTVKVPLWTGAHNEFVWLAPFKVGADGRVTGILNNRPVDTTKFRKGQSLTFPISSVADWSYFDGDRMMGNFTTCVLIAREPKAEADAFRKANGLVCEG